MTVFDIYSHYYDLLYKDKDYSNEVNYIHSLIQDNAPTTHTVLDIGCGTGKHDFHFAQLGYQVTGVDLSEKMVEVATNKLMTDYAICKDKLVFRTGDCRTFRLQQKFDAVVSLFHVMSYQTTNRDLLQSLITAAEHLESGGIFIFDFWYGPGVLNDLPTVRIKRLENEQIAVTRLTEPTVDINRNVVDVHFEVQIKDKRSQSNEIQTIKEVHVMRYFFLPELLQFFEAASLEFVSIKAWLHDTPPTINTWYSVITCKKK